MLEYAQKKMNKTYTEISKRSIYRLSVPRTISRFNQCILTYPHTNG